MKRYIRLILKIFITTAILIIVSSCSSMKSGHYIQLSEKDNLESLAKEFNLTKDKIKELNPGSNFVVGEWIFIPLKRGILGSSIDSTSFDPSKYLKSGEFLWPVPASNSISSGFGRRWGRMHEGVDIPGKVGSNIVAAADGVVVYSGSEIGGYGNITVLAHKNGFFTVYAHAKSNYTKDGQRVYRGQVIAQVGMTGRSSGPHLHFEIRKNGESIDPQNYLANN
jgi:murein DD-endopeptidase MepM/ murein hydrolase activator NlpD